MMKIAKQLIPMYFPNEISKTNSPLRKIRRALMVCVLLVPGGINAAVPALDSVFLGGTVTAVNNNGQAVGFNVDASGVKHGWVYTPGQGMSDLPAPLGWGSSPVDISDTGIIVGLVDDGIAQNADDGATVWRLTTTGYEYAMLDMLPSTDYGSVATGVNSAGDIIGTRTFFGEFTPGRWMIMTRPFLLTYDNVFYLETGDFPTTDPDGKRFTDTPVDINDQRQIVGGLQRLNLDTGLLEHLGTAATTSGLTLNGITTYAINESGQVAGRGFNSRGSFPVYYTDGIGWTSLSNFEGSSDNAAYEINDNGDVLMNLNVACGGSIGAAVYLAAEQEVVCVQQMLSDQSWQISTAAFAAAGITNNRDIAIPASNALTAESGATYLLAVGDLPAPLAPSNLVATKRDATVNSPSIAIDLSWADNSDTESRFVVERAISPNGPNNPWTAIADLAANTTGYEDLDIVALQSYDYRVVAKGLGGDSFSNIATEVAPEPVDVIAPSVTIRTPQTMTNVSASFDVVADVSDNVGVDTVVMELLLNGTLRTICSLSGVPSGEVICSVNSKKFKFQDGDALTISVIVTDAMLNSSRASVDVTWTRKVSTGGDTTKGNGKGKK